MTCPSCHLSECDRAPYCLCCCHKEEVPDDTAASYPSSPSGWRLSTCASRMAQAIQPSNGWRPPASYARRREGSGE